MQFNLLPAPIPTRKILIFSDDAKDYVSAIMWTIRVFIWQSQAKWGNFFFLNQGVIYELEWPLVFWLHS